MILAHPILSYGTQGNLVRYVDEICQPKFHTDTENTEPMSVGSRWFTSTYFSSEEPIIQVLSGIQA